MRFNTNIYLLEFQDVVHVGRNRNVPPFPDNFIITLCEMSNEGYQMCSQKFLIVFVKCLNVTFCYLFEEVNVHETLLFPGAGKYLCTYD